MKKKLNCWEFKNCGRGPMGENVYQMGVCPSATETRLEGVHGGIQAGRACWIVAGTFCGGRSQGVFAKKYATCKDCDFYRRVIDEEGAGFEITLNLMKRLVDDKK